jgi:chromosome segregation ATPase
VSDTPMTDRLAATLGEYEEEHPHAVKFCDLARELERQLAEAESRIQSQKESYDKDFVRLVSQLAEARAERDELNSQLEEAREEIEELKWAGRGTIRRQADAVSALAAVKELEETRAMQVKVLEDECQELRNQLGGYIIRSEAIRDETVRGI